MILEHQNQGKLLIAEINNSINSTLVQPAQIKPASSPLNRVLLTIYQTVQYMDLTIFF